MGWKKSPRQLERHLKGAANHRRIEILQLISGRDGITLVDIADSLQANLKTISEHARKLVQAGLIEKKYAGASVRHSLSPYGRALLKFLATLR